MPRKQMATRPTTRGALVKKHERKTKVKEDGNKPWSWSAWYAGYFNREESDCGTASSKAKAMRRAIKCIERWCI